MTLALRMPIFRKGRESARAPFATSALPVAAESAGRLLLPACLLVLAASLMFGGGTRGGFLGDAVLQFLTLPALVVVAVEVWRRPGGLGGILEMIVAAAIVAIPILHAMPVSPETWQRFPIPNLRLGAFSLAERPPGPMPLSLSPYESRLAALSLLAPVVLFMGLRRLDAKGQSRAAIVLIAFAFTSAFLGLAQIAGGPDSPLRFFAYTNADDAVGFFANRNHLAALLYTALLLACAWSIDSALRLRDQRTRRSQGQKPLVVFALSTTAAFLLASAQILVRSRAGVGLLVVGLLGIAIIALADHRNRWRKGSLWLLGAVILGILLFTLQFGLDRFIQRIQFDNVKDMRLIVARRAIAAVGDFWPYGSGIGTFDSIYAMYEQAADLQPHTMINHAHNDYLQLALEAGLPGLVVLAVCLAWIGWRLFAQWRPSDKTRAQSDVVLRRTAALAVFLLLLHSAVDYPLRTGAGLAMFATLLALISPVWPSSSDAFRRPIA